MTNEEISDRGMTYTRLTLVGRKSNLLSSSQPQWGGNSAVFDQLSKSSSEVKSSNLVVSLVIRDKKPSMSGRGWMTFTVPFNTHSKTTLSSGWRSRKCPGQQKQKTVLWIDGEERTVIISQKETSIPRSFYLGHAMFLTGLSQVRDIQSYRFLIKPFRVSPSSQSHCGKYIFHYYGTVL